MSIKEKEQNKKFDVIKKAKSTELYKAVLEKFSDADLLDVNLKNQKDKNND